MKKIVNGRLYDTNEALVVCSWRETTAVFGLEVEAQFMLCREKVAENPLEGLKLATWGGVSDYEVKKDASKGDFFFVVQVCGPYGPGRIRPLDVCEAKQIFEEHTDSDYNLEEVYQRYFGIRPGKSDLETLKEAFKAGAEAKRKQYEEAEAGKKAEAETF